MLKSSIVARFRAAPPLVALIAANLVPLVGAAFGGWRLSSVMVLYWLENGVIGVVTIARMLLSGLAREGPPPVPRNRDTAAGAFRRLSTALPLVLFFTFHYGVFWIVHGVFVLALFGGRTPLELGSGDTRSIDLSGVDVGAVETGLIGLAVYHLVAFLYWDVARGEARAMAVGQIMFQPYPRLIVLHITILVGAVAIAATGQPIAALVLLVVLKTAIDLGTQFVPGIGRRSLTHPAVVVS